MSALYVAEHQLRGMRAYGWTVVVGGIGSPLLYLLGLGLGLATFIDTPVASGPHGPVDYVVFVAPALVATAAVTVATEEFTYTIMAGFKWRRLFWGINATPVEPRQIAGGLVLATLVRMVFTVAAYAVLALAFGALDRAWSVLVLPFVGVLGGLAFGLPLMAYSASITEDKGQFAAVQRFVFTPMFLFSGTFYPLSTLPVWLHWIGWVSPLWHASQLGRWLSYGESEPGWLLATHLVVLVGLAAAGWVLAARTFTRRLRA
ncbi:ABC transporter permease [Luteimicrobium subarcticum]|uniref:Transport permease protein n=1 Tax=Luteimicrobium subarcticum TaxID=620910 RepID=A0A2M8WSS6_9MICO|nr:ABC transporter permease [Luteimicrobium subarcticum]PJI93983.1 lipooligosaccharide transport system permease protein [Luteimicrobium subarcticum]